MVLQYSVQCCSVSQWITWSRAADLFDSSLLRLSAAAWQQSFSLVAKTVKFIPSHWSNCHRGETESRLSYLWETAAHDNDPAHFSSLSRHNKTAQGHVKAVRPSFSPNITTNEHISHFYTLIMFSVTLLVWGGVSVGLLVQNIGWDLCNTFMVMTLKKLRHFL